MLVPMLVVMPAGVAILLVERWLERRLARRLIQTAEYSDAVCTTCGYGIKEPARGSTRCPDCGAPAADRFPYEAWARRALSTVADRCRAEGLPERVVRARRTANLLCVAQTLLMLCSFQVTPVIHRWSPVVLLATIAVTWPVEQRFEHSLGGRLARAAREGTVLCIRCDYLLKGPPPHTGRCPECGTPVADSIPYQGWRPPGTNLVNWLRA